MKNAITFEQNVIPHALMQSEYNVRSIFVKR